MLDAFVYLNLPELEIANVKKFSPDLGKLILWCQSVLSYHILIHPFTYRNGKSNLDPNSDMYFFVTTMNIMLNRFYKFKRFLINMNIMNIPLGEYVFNLQHNREKFSETESLGKHLNEKMLANILCFLPYSSSYKLVLVNKKFKEGFKQGNDLILNEISKEIFYLKLQLSERLFKKLPVVFDHNIFSNYFLMVDDILNGDYFLSKEQLNDIKNIKKENPVFIAVAKVIVGILNEKVNKKVMPTGEIKYLYLDQLKTIVLNGTLSKALKNNNKLDIPLNKLNSLHDDLQNLLSFDKLEEIRKMNRGVAQLVNWIILVYEYHKIFNPFDFVSSDYITNRFDEEDLDIIKYFCQLMNYFRYNLKVKFRFSRNFEFKKLFEELKTFLKSQNVSIEGVFDTTPEYAKIAGIYFETKDQIPIGAKPAFFERILNESLKASVISKKRQEGTLTDNIGGNNLGTIREENSITEKMKENKSLNNNNNINNPNKENNKIQLLNHYAKSKPQKVMFNDIPNEIVIKQVLFYLDINSLPKLSICNKKTNECVKTHIFIRMHYLNKEKKLIEKDNSEIIDTIEAKRKEFYEEYEVEMPNKNHAINLMQTITNNVSKYKRI